MIAVCEQVFQFEQKQNATSPLDTSASAERWHLVHAVVRICEVHQFVPQLRMRNRLSTT
jgi:hypothetical protein